MVAAIGLLSQKQPRVSSIFFDHKDLLTITPIEKKIAHIKD